LPADGRKNAQFLHPPRKISPGELCGRRRADDMNIFDHGKND